MSKPTLLYLGEPIKWNHDLYQTLCETFNVVRSESPTRDLFIQDLREGKYGDFSAMYRPDWNSGIEMGNWDSELMYVLAKLK